MSKEISGENSFNTSQSDYDRSFQEMTSRTPQLTADIIQETQYLWQIERAKGSQEALVEHIYQRRFERRWLRSHLGKQEFVRRRRAGELQQLFDWPRSVPRYDSERTTGAQGEELGWLHPIFQDDLFDDGAIDIKTFEEIERLDRQDS